MKHISRGSLLNAASRGSHLCGRPFRFALSCSQHLLTCCCSPPWFSSLYLRAVTMTTFMGHRWSGWLHDGPRANALFRVGIISLVTLGDFDVHRRLRLSDDTELRLCDRSSEHGCWRRRGFPSRSRRVGTLATFYAPKGLATDGKTLFVSGEERVIRGDRPHHKHRHDDCGVRGSCLHRRHRDKRGLRWPHGRPCIQAGHPVCG